VGRVSTLGRPGGTDVDTSDLSELRLRLDALELQLRGDVDSHREQLVEPAAATGNTFVAGAEGAAADSDDERELALLRHSQHELDEVVAAIVRIDAGSYGQCEGCGEPIGLARLRARPEARLCVGCQSAAERGRRAG
jgi:DnaK suppressor protein